MAIFDKYVVEVRIDGKPVKEFEQSNIDHDDGFESVMVEKYIQSQPGKNYTVSMRVEPQVSNSPTLRDGTR